MNHQHKTESLPTPAAIRTSAAQIRRGWSSADTKRRTQMAQRLQQRLLQIAALGLLTKQCASVA